MPPSHRDHHSFRQTTRWKQAADAPAKPLRGCDATGTAVSMVLFFERRMTAVWGAFGLFRPSSRYPQKLATKSCVPIMTTEADEVYDWLPSLARRNRRSRRIDKGVSCSNLELKERGGVVQGHSGFSVVLPPAETSSPPDFEQSLRAVFSNNQGWRQNSWGSNAYTDIHSGMHSITPSMSVS